MQKDYALVIGINDYTPPENSGLRTLKAAISDADSMEEWLLDSNGGNLPKSNIRKITSISDPLTPLQDQVDDAFLSIEADIKNKWNRKARRLYFYFAGHGLGTIESTTNTALCLANWSENRRKSALSSELYKETIKQYGYFEEIIFVADCCRNMKINVTPLQPTFSPPMTSPTAGATKLFVAYATQYDDAAHEIETPDSEMRGAFTKVLLDGLKGDAADENGCINADRLNGHLRYKTPILAKQLGFKQIPEITISSFDDTPIICIEGFGERTVMLKITFLETTKDAVELIEGENLDVLITYQPLQNRKVQIPLKKGKYFLKDTVTGKKLKVTISPLKTEENVEF